MVKKKIIWYISHYIAPPDFDTHSRAIKFARYLNQAGYEVTIFSSSFLHYKNINLIEDSKKYIQKDYGDIKFVHIKTANYVNNGFLRIYSLLQFSLRIFFLRKKFEKPDIIIHTAQVPFENFTYYVARSLGAEYIAEVLDLWPESFVAYGILKRRNPLLKLAYMTEKWLYKRADKVVFSMEGGRDYIIEKGWNTENGGPVNLSKIHYVNNGVDIEDFDKNRDLYKIADPDLDDDSLFRVTYLGSIRHANNLKQLIDAAELLKDYKNIRFLIYGDGSERNVLEKYCMEKNILNVYFKKKWIELRYVPHVLSRSALNIINYMPTNILRYGGSQGKLFQYLASGKPICSNQKMGYCLIENNNLGISKSFETAQQFADAILSFYNMNKTAREEMEKRVRKVAEQFDYRILAEQLIKVIEQ